MTPRPLRLSIALALIFFAVLFGVILASVSSLRQRNRAPLSYWSAPGSFPTAALLPTGRSPIPGLPTPRPFDAPILTPTPDFPHVLPTLRSDPEQYAVQPGDTLGQIARGFGVSIQQIIQANGLLNPDLLEIGQSLTIPAPTPVGAGPAFKIIPDSELVYGPASALFDVEDMVERQFAGGFLASYTEEVDEAPLSGAQIVLRLAQEYSVNPRLLLAVLEHRSAWLSQPNPTQQQVDYPLGMVEEKRKGLYRQLAWAANELNRGYYLWRLGALGSWLLTDGGVMLVDPTLNAGTAAVQHLYAQLAERFEWQQAVSEEGLFAVYLRLFGYPFDYAVEPLLPPSLAQPTLQLPFELGDLWAFTGGPHGGWGDGAAWAALDFAPPGDALGCVVSDAWLTAVADGLVVRSGNGTVLLDLDGDGYEQTGWVVLYMHVEARDRVAAGTFLEAGERIGHPSCEGGVATGTHVHLARRYNGEWIPADQGLPFVLDGWISSGTGVEYNGYLQRGDQTLEAFAGRSGRNGIRR